MSLKISAVNVNNSANRNNQISLNNSYSSMDTNTFNQTNRSNVSFKGDVRIGILGHLFGILKKPDAIINKNKIIAQKYNALAEKSFIKVMDEITDEGINKLANDTLENRRKMCKVFNTDNFITPSDNNDPDYIYRQLTGSLYGSKGREITKKSQVLSDYGLIKNPENFIKAMNKYTMLKLKSDRYARKAARIEIQALQEIPEHNAAKENYVNAYNFLKNYEAALKDAKTYNDSNDRINMLKTRVKTAKLRTIQAVEMLNIQTKKLNLRISELSKEK